MDLISEIVFPMGKVIFSFLAACLLTMSCQVDYPEKYIPRNPKKKELLATPEPGTYLKPVAYGLLVEINHVMDNPDSFKGPADWMIEILATQQRKLVDTTINHSDREVDVRIYYPTRKSLKGHHPVTIFLHGGGFVKGSVEEYHMMVSKLARITGNIVVSVDYRLAPEFPFPAAINDCYAVLSWVQENSAKIGADKNRISVMGDSAGGNIATVLTLMCRDRHGPQPQCQVLIYPGVTFVDTLYPSRLYFGKSNDMDYVLNEEFLRKVKSQYMGEETNSRLPYLSPLEADLSPDLAPALIITAECDPIRDGGRLYAEKMRSSGIPTIHVEYSGMIHGFMSFHMILGDALDAMKIIRDYLDSFKNQEE